MAKEIAMSFRLTIWNVNFNDSTTLTDSDDVLD